MAELEKLLAFMSSWDRQAALDHYAELFDAAKDPQALIEELGTPTKIAVDLAKDYVSSPPPVSTAPEPAVPEEKESGDVPEPAETEAPGEAAAVPDPVPAPAAPEKPQPEARMEEDVPPVPERRKAAFPLRLLYWLFLIVLGLPVAALLILVGVPFLAAGVGVIAAAVTSIPGAVSGFRLLSDMLLVAGAGLVMLAAGLLLAWLGLWLSITLCRLWIEKVILSLGRRVYFGA